MNKWIRERDITTDTKMEVPCKRTYILNYVIYGIRNGSGFLVLSNRTVVQETGEFLQYCYDSIIGYDFLQNQK